MRCEEGQELITALVDDELSSLERASVEGHLEECLKCQQAYEAERLLKWEIRLAGARLSAPADLREKILRDPRLSAERTEPVRRWMEQLRPWRLLLRPAFALALAALLGLPIYYWARPTGPSVALAALRIHEGVVAGAASFGKASTAEEITENLSRSVGGSFGPMGYDLSVVNLEPAGWMVQEINGRKILVTVYQGQVPSLTCYTFRGTEKDAPPDAVVFFDPEKRIRFYTFSQGGVNAVFHREGDLICILVSKMPMQELLALARAKARPS